MYFKVFVFLTIVMSCHMAPPLSKIQKIRELLEEIRVLQEHVNPLDSGVMDIVEKVYSPDLQTRLTRTNDEEDRNCDEGWKIDKGSVLLTISKQLPTFLHKVWGLNHRPQRWKASVLPHSRIYNLIR